MRGKNCCVLNMMVPPAACGNMTHSGRILSLQRQLAEKAQELALLQQKAAEGEVRCLLVGMPCVRAQPRAGMGQGQAQAAMMACLAHKCRRAGSEGLRALNPSPPPPHTRPTPPYAPPPPCAH